MELPTGRLASAGYSLLTDRTLQKVSAAQRKQLLSLPKVVRGSSSPEYESGSGGGRSIVDANMPLLRKRIKKLKIQEEERNRDRAPPEEELESEWMEWEKKLYPTYHFKVCEMIGLLHSYLMNTRPSVALATLSLTVFFAAASVLVLLVTSINSIHLSRFRA